jgi:hypothetical protein
MRADGPCSQPPQPYFLYNGYNNCGVLNGAKPAVFTLGKPTHITSVADYHWNNGVGAPGGTIGVQAANGYVFGPYRAKQDADHNWIANMSVTVPAGTYTVVDSSPGTWSQNQASGGRGFVRVFGSYVASAPPVPKPAKSSSSSPSPAQTPAGGKVSLLLSCQKPQSLGFQGAFAPSKVLIYDEASYRNLKYVGGYLQPISPSFPVRTPATAPFTVKGPNDLQITVPGSLSPGTYVTIIVYSKGEVAPQNLLHIS